MVQKTITVVKIGGRRIYNQKCGIPGYIHKVAIYVNNKIEEVEARQPNLSTSMVVMLAAINLADEVIKLRIRLKSSKGSLVRCIRFGWDDDVSVPSNVYDVSRRAQR